MFSGYLWMAPEHIRDEDKIGSQSGDVYSFAIICSELINRRPAWNYTDREDEIDGATTVLPGAS